MLQAKERQDLFYHKGQRAQLIVQLRQLGIKDEKVLQAFDRVPRHFFLDPAFEKYAYENRAFEISAGQTLSHPYTVAHQTEQLQIKKFDKVLEIGTGSLFQSCILAEMGAQVYTIERQQELFQYVKHFFMLKKYPLIKPYYGDGYLGLPTYAPFNKIIVTAGAPFIPEALVEQLKPGGRMSIPVNNDQGKQIMNLLIKDEQGNIQIHETGEFNFVPMLEGKNS